MQLKDPLASGYMLFSFFCVYYDIKNINAELHTQTQGLYFYCSVLPKFLCWAILGNCSETYLQFIDNSRFSIKVSTITKYTEVHWEVSTGNKWPINNDVLQVQLPTSSASPFGTSLTKLGSVSRSGAHQPGDLQFVSIKVLVTTVKRYRLATQTLRLWLCRLLLFPFV